MKKITSILLLCLVTIIGYSQPVYLEPGQSGETLRTSFNLMVDAVESISLSGKKLAIIGDSHDVSTWQSTAISVLNLGSVINVAASGARHNDNEGGTTQVNIATYPSVSVDNTLSNQVRRLIQDSFTLGDTITWTHPITGTVTTIDISKGAGLGNTPPDVIIILLGQNGGQGALTDSDFNTVIGQSYSALDRLNQFSSMRWAIETLSIVFPTVPIFVASTYQNPVLTYATGKIRADIAKRMAEYMNAIYIDAFAKSGIQEKFEQSGGHGRYLYDGNHLGWPGGGASEADYDGRILVGRFYAEEIRRGYISRL